MLNMKRGFSALAFIGALVAGSVSANATIIVDGLYDSAYGPAKSTVLYNPSAPSSNFGTPTNESAYIGYSIFLKAEGGNVYGFLEASGPGASVAPFANLYWDLDPANGNGSDLGFQLAPGTQNAFIPGVDIPLAQSNITVVSLNNTSLEFAIPNVDFTSAIAGLTYNSGQAFAGSSGNIALRLSQSFGYSVAGGDSYGVDRLGAVTLAAAAPEVSTWIMMLLGFGFLGFVAFRRTRVAEQKIAIA